MARRPGGFSIGPGPERPSLNFGEGNFQSPARARRNLGLDIEHLQNTRESSETDSKFNEVLKLSGNLNINGIVYKTDLDDLEHLGELGNGTCGHVVKMKHHESNQIIAVKQMRRSGNKDENKRIIMDLEVVLKSHDCPFIVQCLGCFITDSDVWICMELMTTCMDKLLKKLKEPIPEMIIGKVSVATVKALNYLKENHGVIHRDVKPSNILLDERGIVKLCDFGISGRLVDSKAKTRSAGCTAYMAPERIDPPDLQRPDYDIRADVWSLGITLVELATGKFPYGDCSTDFEVMTRILTDEPPSLPKDRHFTQEFRNFVSDCLAKDYHKRPKYKVLLNHPFIKISEAKAIEVKTWLNLVCGSRRIQHYTNSSSFPSRGIDGRYSARLRGSNFTNNSASINSSGHSSLTSPLSLRPSRYEEFSLPISNSVQLQQQHQQHQSSNRYDDIFLNTNNLSTRPTLRTNFDRLNSEPLPNMRSPSSASTTPGTPSPNSQISGSPSPNSAQHSMVPPEPPPRYSRMNSDGLRTPTPNSNSSSASSGGSSGFGTLTSTSSNITITPSPVELSQLPSLPIPNNLNNRGGTGTTGENIPTPPMRRYFPSRLFFTPEPTRRKIFQFFENHYPR